MLFVDIGLTNPVKRILVVFERRLTEGPTKNFILDLSSLSLTRQMVLCSFLSRKIDPPKDGQNSEKSKDSSHTKENKIK